MNFPDDLCGSKARQDSVLEATVAGTLAQSAFKASGAFGHRQGMRRPNQHLTGAPRCSRPNAVQQFVRISM
jgi:hypothetical protein